MKSRIITAAMFLIVSCVALLPITGIFNHELTLELNGNQTLTLGIGDVYEESGCKAVYKGFRSNEDVSDKVTETGDFATDKPGTYELTYTVTIDKITKEVKRTIVVLDNNSPVIDAPESVSALVGTPISKIACSFTATDNIDGDITSKVNRTDKENEILLSVRDSSGNLAEKTVAVKYFEDHTPPVISLKGGSHVYIKQGVTYSDSGFSAKDAVWGNLFASVEMSGDIDTNTPGTYTVNYQVTDGSGNTGYASRQVTVFRPWNGNTTGVTPNGYTIFLTFDDGPGCYTAQILDILATYNVKATFFVTNQFGSFQYLIAREAAEGHAIGAHTYSHQYSIYSSMDAYFNDLEAINSVIEAQTGHRTNLMRFPGGSSNTVSRRYATGIMSALSNETQNRGYVYFDWNLSSGDASGHSSANSIISTVTNNLGSGNYVVLMHDIKAQEIDALPAIIEYGLAHGYTFCALNENSPTCHQGIAN